MSGNKRLAIQVSNFLLEARQNLGYEKEPETKRLPDGKRIIGPFCSGGLTYKDTYVMNGLYWFKGIEKILRGRNVVWKREYEGGIIDESHKTEKAAEAAYKILREAMRRFRSGKPFMRGPSAFQSGDYIYHDNCDGDIGSFIGVERITDKGKEIYALNYSGGIRV